jgi:phage shock protein C
MATRLVRPRSGKVLAGVCAAVAERLGLPRWLVRVAFVLFGLFGVGEIAYLVLWVLIPKEPA